MSGRLAISELNALEASAFASHLAHVFEHAPWVAERAAARRPFASRDALHQAMRAVIAAADEAEQLALLRGHPDLAGKAAVGDLTPDSRREQQGAGLDRLTAAEYERFHALNRDYTARFGFPFILAVKGKTKGDILAAFAARVGNARDVEFRTALDQVGRIAAFRLADLVEG